jgi:hypothetical protein
MNATETIALLDQKQAASVAAIIALLADKVVFEERFKAIRDLAEQTDQKMADLVKQTERVREVDVRETALAEREQTLAATEKASREEHTRMDVALAAREKRIEQREGLLAEGQAALAQAKTQVDAQIASMAEVRALAQSLRSS